MNHRPDQRARVEVLTAPFFALALLDTVASAYVPWSRWTWAPSEALPTKAV